MNDYDYEYRDKQKENFVRTLKAAFFDVVADNQRKMDQIEYELGRTSNKERIEALQNLWAQYHDTVKECLTHADNISNCFELLDSYSGVFDAITKLPLEEVNNNNYENTEVAVAAPEIVEEVAPVVEAQPVDVPAAVEVAPVDVASSPVDNPVNEVTPMVENPVAVVDTPVPVEAAAVETAPVEAVNPPVEVAEVPAAVEVAPVDVASSPVDNPVNEVTPMVENPVEAVEVPVVVETAPVDNPEVVEAAATEVTAPADVGADIVEISPMETSIETPEIAPVEAQEVSTETETLTESPADEAQPVLVIPEEAPSEVQVEQPVQSEPLIPIAETPKVEQAPTNVVLTVPSASTLDDDAPVVSTQPSNNIVATFTKETIGEDKAILVNQKQVEKLRSSLDTQQVLVNEIFARGKEENVSQQQLEEMMNQLSSLYEQGKTEEAEQLSEQISVLSKKMNTAA